jgi:shikimate dehydrogenase
VTGRISGRIGLIGDPVEHSLSPIFQQAAFDALGIDVTYELLPTPADQIEQRVAQLRDGEFIGVNVTVPHKERFFQEVDELSDISRRVGAVNTIVVRESRLLGDNTDVYGFVRSLHDADFKFDGSRTIVLGAGGASRAIVVGLLDSGVGEVVIGNRSVERASVLAADIGDPRVLPMTLAAAEMHAEGANLLVNATSLGWQDDQLPISRSIFDVLGPDAIAYDLTYRDTAFLNTAREYGVATLDGLTMLVHQGARSFEIWTGREAPVDVMLRAAIAAR